MVLWQPTQLVPSICVMRSVRSRVLSTPERSAALLLWSITGGGSAWQVSPPRMRLARWIGSVVSEAPWAISPMRVSRPDARRLR